MRQLYKENTANYPRLKTDTFFTDFNTAYCFNGLINEVNDFIEKHQLLNTDLWKRFIQQFIENADSDYGWRGEFWGKLMRGACLTYSCTKNPRLYEILEQSIRDMLEVQSLYGRISSYEPCNEFTGWDLWCRKYVLLGMQYFLEICEDNSLSQQIIDSMCKQLDDIISKIGDEKDGKIPITTATRHWRGLNSSSILEPVVRLYTITQNQKYFDFATYIVNCGGTDVENLFELAFEDKMYPYQYPVTKAYELMSCFEGLLEYYRVTGIDKYKVAVINFVNKVLESDFTIIGSCGCTEELFDHSTVRQANTTNGMVQQETCVTVTLMKLLYQLNLLTGDSKYADAFEISAYNAFLGAINTNLIINSYLKNRDLNLEPLTFDSYSPLTAGVRGCRVAGYKVMSDKHYYGCCASIGATGSGLIPKMALLTSSEGFVMNLFLDGTINSVTPRGNKISFVTRTEYPSKELVEIKICLEQQEEFEIKIRNPFWSKKTKVKINNKHVQPCEGYISLTQQWENGDTIQIEFDMRTQVIYPIPYGQQILMNKVIWGKNYIVPTFDEEDPLAKKHIALRRGPIILAQDNRLGYDVDEPVDIDINPDGYVDVSYPAKKVPFKHIVAVSVPLKDGTYFEVVDYGSSGKLWSDESKIAAWILIK